MKKILLSLIIFMHLFAGAQDLTGLWQGTYTHYTPTCCGEVTYNCTFKIFEDERGALWAENASHPTSNNKVIGEFCSGGFKSKTGIIFISDVKETFSTMQYSNSCFKKCRWCKKEFAFEYVKENDDEILYGRWNSKECFPGGDIRITKVKDLAMEESISIIKQIKNNTTYYDPGYVGTNHPLNIYKAKDDSTMVSVSIGGTFSYYKLKVENPTDLVENIDKIKVQNVTMEIRDGMQVICYFELFDTRTKKIYSIGEKPTETMDLVVSHTGLTFPNKQQWETILVDRQEITKTEIEVTDTPIYAEIWDNNMEDGDIITLSLNGKRILHKFTLSKKREKIKLDLKKGKNILVMFAENLGSIPPNTAAIKFTVDGKTHTLILASDLNKSEAIRFIVK